MLIEFQVHQLPETFRWQHTVHVPTAAPTAAMHYSANATESDQPDADERAAATAVLQVALVIRGLRPTRALITSCT